MSIFKYIKGHLFKKYVIDYEYWIRLDEIKVPKYMLHSRINEEKYKHKWKYYKQTGELESKIILDENLNLLDGYSSYKIAKIAGLEKVPVYFKKMKQRGDMPF